MKFIIKRASNWAYRKEVDISSIEDLKVLADRYRRQLVVNFQPFSHGIPEIIVYDGYLE